MIRLLRPIAAKIRPILILLIILGGIATVVARLLLPLAEGYREDVQQLASDMLGQPVEITKLSAQWRGFGPELVLEGIHLADPESSLAALRLTEIRVGIGILDTLRSGKLTPREITVYGVHLLIKRRSDGSIVVSGLEDLGLDNQKDDTIFSLPYRISLKQGELIWENQAIGAEPLRFTDVDVTLTNDQDRHQLDVVLSLPGSNEARMTLAADVTGEFHRPGGWSGDFFLRGNKLAMEKILASRIPAGYSMSGDAYIELWSRWDRGYMTTLQGGVNWRQLKLLSDQLDANGRPRQLELDELGGQLKWQRNDNGWQLDINDIKLAHHGQQWPASSMSLVTRYDQAGLLHIRSGIDFLQVEDVLTIIGMFPLPEMDIDQALITLKPQANLHALQFRFDETPNGPTWGARGRVSRLFTNPWKKVPGVKNLDASFWLNQDQGELKLQGRGVSAAFPQLFRDMLKLDELSGLLRWERLPQQGWRIESKEIHAVNQDIKSRTRLRIDIPHDPAESLLLDLQTDFHDGDASTTSRYLPVTIMPDAVVAWLDRSLVSGDVVSGSCIFQGPVRSFPFEDNNRGRFEVLFGVENMILDYWPQWPRSEDLTAEVRFLNNHFDAWVESGKILSSDLHNIHGRIEHLSKASPFLLNGKVTGPLHDGLRILSESPLSERFSTLAAAVKADGDADLELDLTIPIKSGQFKLDGQLTFSDSGLFIQEWQLPITNISGDLKLSESGVRSDNLQGKLLGQTLTATVTPVSDSGATRISGDVTLSSNTLAQQFPGNYIEELQGSTSWQMQLDLPPRSDKEKELPPILRLTSNLKGIHIDQPRPFGKTEESERQLQLEAELTTAKQRQVKISYSDAGEAVLLLDRSGPKTKLVRGGVTFSSGAAILPNKDVLQIRGRLNSLNLTPWLKVADSAETELPPIVTTNFRISKLRYADTTLDNAVLNLSSTKSSFGGRISSKSMDGRFEVPVPLRYGPIVARFDRIDLAFDPDDLEDKSASLWADPRTLPSLDLRSKKTTINGRNYGLLELLAKHVKDGLELKTIALNSERLNLSAHGEWIMFNDRPQTAIDMHMRGESLGKLLKHLGFAPSIEGAPVKMDASLRWSGNPRQFSSTDLHGKLDMRLGKGRILEVNPGMGRAFGLLNLGALQRRLTLDFSDLFKKGLSFDLIDGSFRLDDGDAYTNDLRLEGPSADIEILGRIGLVDRDFDQVATITPKITGSLPVIGAITGGPVVGAALYLAQKVVGKKVDQANDKVYTITGSWDNPTIIPQKQDFTIGLSKLEGQPTEPDTTNRQRQSPPKAKNETWENPLFNN